MTHFAYYLSRDLLGFDPSPIALFQNPRLLIGKQLAPHYQQLKRAMLRRPRSTSCSLPREAIRCTCLDSLSVSRHRYVPFHRSCRASGLLRAPRPPPIQSYHSSSRRAFACPANLHDGCRHQHKNVRRTGKQMTRGNFIKTRTALGIGVALLSLTAGHGAFAQEGPQTSSRG